MTRAAIVRGLDDLGIAIDPTANTPVVRGERSIHSKQARVGLWVIPTNEELIVARQTRDLLAAQKTTQQTHPQKGH